MSKSGLLLILVFDYFQLLYFKVSGADVYLWLVVTVKLSVLLVTRGKLVALQFYL